MWADAVVKYCTMDMVPKLKSIVHPSIISDLSLYSVISGVRLGARRLALLSLLQGGSSRVCVFEIGAS